MTDSNWSHFLQSLDNVVDVEVNDEDKIGLDTSVTQAKNKEELDYEDEEYLRTLREDETSCCMLGRLAGDKGYHCHVKFYANRIMKRNGNRAHNRKLSFYGRERLPNFGVKIMAKFEKCVVGRGYSFNTCCHIAARERRLEHYNSYLKYKNTLKSKQ
ncbi:uncharacterized protein B4U79_13122 [Dinothrombium tinctorium]|uniref:Uncharacterized protein n=1 Tax=Dinothrombium tinctorium TaxID=1965070 RepID=A0A3S3P2N1_9ACAR|nr:uncharacterized protein B4U79_13122 [Dinothrombium tinctorium]